MVEAFSTFIDGMGIFSLTWQMIVMWAVVAVLLYMGVAKQFEPLLLVPIAFGALIANIPDNGMVLTQANSDIISISPEGKVEKNTVKNVGYLRLQLAPLNMSATPIEGVNDKNRVAYDAATADPMTATQAYKAKKAVEDVPALGYEKGDTLFYFFNTDADGNKVPVSLTEEGAVALGIDPSKLATGTPYSNLIPAPAGTPLTITAAQLYVKDGMYDKPVADGTPDAEPIVLKGQMDLTGQKTQDYALVSLQGGLYDFIGLGIRSELFPPLIFMGVGALTDFAPLLASPRSLLLGAAAQVGVAFTFFAACLMGFTKGQAASIGIIGGADGPTSIFLSSKLAPELLGAIAVAAYTYMALVPLIQPPIMMLLTTHKERRIRMKSLRQVSKGEKLFFAVLVTVVTILLIPDAAALIGMLMFGNFLRECRVTERLVGAAQNELMNIVTILLGTSVGLTMQGERFLQPQTIGIIFLGVIAFMVATAGGVLFAKIMNLVWRKNPINPLIGSAGVSAVPMAARVSHNVGQKEDPSNYLLMHAMGPNVAGVIGTAVIAGYYIATLSK